jgi:hypothetical protein
MNHRIQSPSVRLRHQLRVHGPALDAIATAVEVLHAVRAGRIGRAEALARACPGAPALRRVRALRMSLDSAGMPDARAACIRAGHRWRIELGRRHAEVPNSVGMIHLAALLANPGHEIPSIELVAGLATIGASIARGSTTTGQPILDRIALQQYRRRLRDLDRHIDKADQNGNHETRSERDWLIAHLSGATALFGRPRPFANDEERARTAVARAVRRAVARITEADPVIGAHLQRAVRTGVRCCYRPG